MSKNDPIRILTDEHAVISAVQELINNAENRWETDAGQYATDVGQWLVFFRDYSDGFHHHKEEKVLFPALAAHPEFMMQGLLEELEEHHELFRQYARECAQALEAGKWAVSHDILRRYISDLLDHIAVEDDELFVMAENLFDDRELERIFFLFRDIDAELGEARKRELEGMVGG